MGLLGQLAACTALVLYTNSRLSKLLPDPRVRRKLDECLTSRAGKVLELHHADGEIGWSSPLLLDSWHVDPTVEEHFTVSFPVTAGRQGEVRFFRAKAYIEKLNVGLIAAGWKVLSRQGVEPEEFLRLLRKFADLTALRSGRLSVNCCSSVRCTQAAGAKMSVFALPVRTLANYELRAEDCVLSKGGKLVDSRLGPVFLADCEGALRTPSLCTADGWWTGVRANVMRDTIIVTLTQQLATVQETDVYWSEIFDSTKTKEVFIANDEVFLVPVRRGEPFRDNSQCTNLLQRLHRIHVLPTQTGEELRVTRCTDGYSEEQW